MKLIITKHFFKNLNKIGSIRIQDIEKLVQKFPHSNLLIEIDSFDNSLILKGYLNSKKVRIIILFEKIENIFLPVMAIKKETKKGYNITKSNYINHCSTELDKVIADYKSGNFETIILK